MSRPRTSRALRPGWLAIGLLLSAPARLPADEAEDTGLRSQVMQERQLTPMHEFTVWVGTLPLDAFSKGLTFTGAYTLHFNELLAWELAQFTYSHAVSTGLEAELSELGVGPTPYRVVRQYLRSGVLVKPVYGKLAVLNRVITYGELFVTGGAGYAWLTGREQRPLVDVGAGLRLYLGPHVSLRLDLRDGLFFTLQDVRQELWLALGLSLSLE